MAEINYRSLFQQKSINDAKIIAKLLKVDSVPTDCNNKCTVTGVVRQIPEQILHDPKLNGIIINLSANPTSKDGRVIKWGSDDNTYNLYPDLFRILPRARSVCIITDKEDFSLKGWYDNQGFTKFLGATSNEEDEESDISNNGLYTLVPAGNNTKERYVFTVKENGKMAVICGFDLDSVYYFFGGSKNEHIVINADCPEQISLYRQSFACDIFSTWMKKWNKSTDDQKKSLQKLMLEHTLCAEYNDGKHMVPLKDSEHHIVFFGMINRGPILEDGQLCENIVLTCELFSQLGCDTVEYTIVTENEVSIFREALRYKTGVEGYVIHRQVYDDNNNRWRTVSLEKYKTWWYVIIRMLREFIKGRNSLTDGWQARWQNLLDKRNAEYMQLSENYKSAWYNLTSEFIKWFISKGHTSEKVAFNQNSIGMATVWHQFTFDTGVSDCIDKDAKVAKIYTSGNVPTKKSVSKIAIFLQGTVGLGKSTVGYRLAILLNEMHIKSLAIEQDTFIPKYGIKGSGKACFTEYKKALKAYNIVILQRNNANPQQYSKYLEEAHSEGFYTVFWTPIELFDPVLGIVCMQSLMNREGHIGLKDCPLDKQFQLVLTFLSQIEVPTPNNMVNSVASLHYLVKNYKEISKKNSEAISFYQEYYNDVRLSGHKAKMRSVDEVINKLELKSGKYNELRLPVDVIVRQIIDHVVTIWDKPVPKGHTASIPVSKKQNRIKYIAIVMEESFKEKCLHIISDMGMESKYKTLPNKFMHHITLCYCLKPKYDRELFKKLVKMDSLQVKFSITHLVESSSLLAFACDLGGNNCLVESGLPHITIATAEGVKPAQSVNVLAGNMLDGVKKHPIIGGASFQGKISLII